MQEVAYECSTLQAIEPAASWLLHAFIQILCARTFLFIHTLLVPEDSQSHGQDLA